MPKADVSVWFKKTLVRMIAVWSYRCVEIARSSVCTLCTSQNRYRSTCELKNVQALEKICAYSMLDTKLGKKKKKRVTHEQIHNTSCRRTVIDLLASIFLARYAIREVVLGMWEQKELQGNEKKKGVAFLNLLRSFGRAIKTTQRANSWTYRHSSLSMTSKQCY